MEEAGEAEGTDCYREHCEECSDGLAREVTEKDVGKSFVNVKEENEDEMSSGGERDSYEL